MTTTERKELRERTHLQIAMSAAVAAGLAPDELWARQNIETILERDAGKLKTQWLRERGGGIKGWHYFLRTYGYEERLEIRRKLPICPNVEQDHRGDLSRPDMNC
jgi:hypothetical protein